MAMGPRKGRAVPKFGEWEGNNHNPSAGFTVIFSKARDEKRANHAAATGAPPSTFDPPPPPNPVSAIAPPRLPKNESHCTIKPPNNNKPDPVFNKPHPHFNNKPDPHFNNRPDPNFNRPNPNYNNRPAHNDDQFQPTPKRRWFCCG